MIPMFHPLSWTSVRLTLRLLGLMASCILMTTHARWHIVSVGTAPGESLRSGPDFGGDCKRSAMVVAELRLGRRQTPLSIPPTVNGGNQCIPSGLGTPRGGGGFQRSPVESELYINLFELRAICLALKAFLPSFKGRLVHVFTDPTTAMRYCNKQGRVGSWTLCQEALCLWTWLERQGISLAVQHLAGSLNVRADELSL